VRPSSSHELNAVTARRSEHNALAFRVRALRLSFLRLPIFGVTVGHELTLVGVKSNSAYSFEKCAVAPDAGWTEDAVSSGRCPSLR
jgi:hypothetical protein